MEKFDSKNIKAIIGLGNPGSKYVKNRHNIGFRVVDELCDRFGGAWQDSGDFEYAKISLDGDQFSTPNIFLIKPLTFMNNSGKVIPFLSKKGIKGDATLVVHDELEKQFGKMLVSFGGSARGHNGLRSIIDYIGKDFWRFRFGIGRPESKDQVSHYVLSNFSAQEEKELEFLVEQAIDMIVKK